MKIHNPGKSAVTLVMADQSQLAIGPRQTVEIPAGAGVSADLAHYLGAGVLVEVQPVKIHHPRR